MVTNKQTATSLHANAQKQKQCRQNKQQKLDQQCYILTCKQVDRLTHKRIERQTKHTGMAKQTTTITKYQQTAAWPAQASVEDVDDSPVQHITQEGIQ